MMLSREGCLSRQARLSELLARERMDAILLSNPKTIHWATGALVDVTRPHAFVFRPGRSILITNIQPEQAFVDEVRTYSFYTLEHEFARPYWTAGLRDAIVELGLQKERVGTEADWMTSAIASHLGAVADVSPALGQLRRSKEPDEIECIRETIRITEAGYAAARRTLEPGLTEWEVYSAIEQAMVAAARTSVELHGDFACGVRAIGGGGPPSDGVCKEGDLFILDLFPSVGGYVCDLCRTFCVGEPSRAQLALWKRVSDAQDLAGTLLRPGASCSVVYNELRSFLEEYAPASGSFTHHAGHGVGMDGWEMPWLTPGSRSVLRENEVIACEPGLYGEQFAGGVRLEHNYRITGTGAVPLDSFPLGLR